MPEQSGATDEMQDKLDVGLVTAYWMTEAEEAFQVARLHEHAPPIHNLLRLARAAQWEPDEARAEALITITAFNIEARYPDVKRAFRQKCTADYTKRQMTLVRELFAWLRSQML